MVRMFKEGIDKVGHVPKADNLYSVRDMLYILFNNNCALDEAGLMREINNLLYRNQLSAWAKSTFDEYIILMTYLDLAKAENHVIRLNPKITGFLIRNRWNAQAKLNSSERSFFRQKILRYKAIIRFLEIVFCNTKDFKGNVGKMIELSHSVKGRLNALSAWTNYYGVKDNRGARAILTWCLQTGVVEHEQFCDVYFLTQKAKPNYEKFVQSLAKNYQEVYDSELKRAKIPDVRAAVCQDIHIPSPVFDRMLEEVEKNNPTAISMDRATLAREEVAKFGIKRKSFYYYYLKIKGDELK